MTVDDKILDWLGFKLGECNTLLDPEGVLVEVYPQGGKPTINMDFLFEYAVPELNMMYVIFWENGEVHLAYHTKKDLYKVAIGKDKDPVVAFKQALIKVID